MQTTEQVTAQLAQTAQTLYESARAHKRSQEAHRRQARADMQVLDELKRFCEANGISIEIKPIKAKESLHGRREHHTSS